MTIAGDTAGTWAIKNTTGMEIRWVLMAGSAVAQPSKNAWAAANYVGSANQFNFVGTLSNVFELFDVGIYEGAAPAFQLPDYDDELRKCSGTKPKLQQMIICRFPARF
ncbi:hypothetical protein [Bradyrhizobium sp. CCGB20]|uniref:hypothetical protein n=1 Tax=Bradyrhizobium sp. CCGB20 TaxID=2949633 RepID=UPI0020B3B251|nr:hypothetical protein [Bradyrhizobium sp. CCGB20]MCP3397125.1 hypothetical protein [Bradyrhizobium sp. CCGB20]